MLLDKGIALVRRRIAFLRNSWQAIANDRARSVRALWGLIGVVCVLLLLSRFIFYRNVQTLNAQEKGVQHSQMVLTQIERLLSTLNDAEASQRGYILTGRESYLTPYLTARDQINQQMAQLQQITAGDATEQAQLATLTPLITTRFNEMQSTITLRQENQADEAIQVILSDADRSTMEKIRQAVSTMQISEEERLNHYSEQANNSLMSVNLNVAIGSFVIIALLVGLGLIMQQFLRLRDQTASIREESLTRETEARQVAEQALTTRDAFLSIAAHELRSPITSLFTTAQLVDRQMKRQQEPDQSVQRLLDTQVRQAKRLTRLIEMMLDVSRIESGHLSLVVEQFDFHHLVSDIVDEMQLTTTKHTLTLRDDSGPLIIEGDTTRIEQVVTNLIQNAIKYSPDGGEISLTIAREPSRVALTIADQGMGIPAEAIPHLFEPFYRAGNTNEFRGMGIGLYVTSTIIALHGGTISVKSAEGHGSEFTITLPRSSTPTPINADQGTHAEA